MKRNRIVFTLALIIIVIIFFEVISYINKGIEIGELNNMYKDIKILENKIALYFLDYENLPIIKDRKIEFKDKSINPNDNDNYYEIDLNKLENLKLFYGNKKMGINDIYIINEQSHSIYYLAGYKYEGMWIYTRDVDYKYIDLENY